MNKKRLQEIKDYWGQSWITTDGRDEIIELITALEDTQEYKQQNNKMKPTVFDNEQELLKTVLSIHAPNGIELDPMYSKGNFYKEIDKPKYIYDINPQVEECMYRDATNLPLKDNTINSMILDPPFMFGIHGKAEKYIMSTRFGIFKNFAELEILYKGVLKESYRILKIKGVLIFKCQDYTDSKTTMVQIY